ncbi:MAG: response regulator [Planctomycetes bacterium]|nr:response regulator [Planctomycetota bacterium]
MTVLLVDDEIGIREGLATWLGLKGLAVRQADDVATAVALLAAERFDVVVTDWQLCGETAAPLLDAARGAACLVVSGFPDDVVEHAAIVEVLHKPIQPAALLEAIGRAAVVATPAACAPAVARPTGDAALPRDVAVLVAAVRALLGTGAGSLELRDDGLCVTACGRLLAADPELRAALATLGGDLRWSDGGATFELRWFRDGRPDGVAAVVRWDDRDWPAGVPVAIDLDGADTAAPGLDVRGLLALAARGAGRGPSGGPAPLLNLPPALEVGVVALGREGELPKRSPVGPRIPAELDQLWR